MPQILHKPIIQTVTSQDGEVTVKLEITLNLNLGNLPVTMEKEQAKIRELDYIIPEFKSTEVINFGKE